jgi:hypothetical protein
VPITKKDHQNGDPIPKAILCQHISEAALHPHKLKPADRLAINAAIAFEPLDYRVPS